MANFLEIKKNFEEFRQEFNLDDSAKRLDLDFFYGIDWQLLRIKMRESTTCLMLKKSSAYIIKNYVRIINDEMKDFPESKKGKTGKSVHFKAERKYTPSLLETLVDDIATIEF